MRPTQLRLDRMIFSPRAHGSIKTCFVLRALKCCPWPLRWRESFQVLTADATLGFLENRELRLAPRVSPGEFASQHETGAGKHSASMRRETTISHSCSSHASGFMGLSMMGSRKQQLTTMLWYGPWILLFIAFKGKGVDFMMPAFSTHAFENDNQRDNDASDLGVL